MKYSGFGIFALIIAAGVAANWYLQPVGAWAATMALMLALVALIGFEIKGRVDGIVVDNRNRVSLSKFQALAWTLLILSALVTAVAWNLGFKGGAATAGNITIQGELLAAMGIAATSLVAAPLVLRLKTRETTNPASLNAAAAAMQSAGSRGTVTAAGAVVARTDPGDASWLDLFRGDEVDNADAPDLGKVQQFLITLVLIAVYVGMLIAMFDGLSKKPITALPALSEQLIWLMGISHAGYLAYKAAPHSGSAPGVAPAPGAAAGGGAPVKPALAAARAPVAAARAPVG